MRENIVYVNRSMNEILLKKKAMQNNVEMAHDL